VNPVGYISMNKNALWECDICGKTEFDNDKLKQHILNDHEDPEKPSQTKLKVGSK